MTAEPARCRKTRTFATKVAARIALVDCQARHREECAFHWCSEHHGYHLTSMEQNSGGRVIAC